MKHTKKIIALFLAMLMVLSLAACGSKGGDTTPEAPANDGQKYTSRIGHSDTTQNLIHISLEIGRAHV